MTVIWKEIYSNTITNLLTNIPGFLSRIGNTGLASCLVRQCICHNLVIFMLFNCNLVTYPLCINKNFFSRIGNTGLASCFVQQCICCNLVIFILFNYNSVIFPLCINKNLVIFSTFD